MSKDDFKRQIAIAAENLDLTASYEKTGIKYLVKALEALKENPVLDGHVPVRLFNGSVMYINAREEVGKTIFTYKAYELGLTQFIIDFLNPGMTFLDVGSHYGYFSIIASNLVGDLGRVFSFEPTPDVARFLRSNTCSYPNVTVSETAVGDINGQSLFNDYGSEHSAFNSIFGARIGNGSSVPAKQVTVPLVRLDTFCLDRNIVPEVIKIDAESSEMNVLLGMGDLLGQVKAIIVELGDFDELISLGVAQSGKILDYVKSFGYELYTPTINGLQPHVIKSSNYDYCNVVCLKQ